MRKENEKIVETATEAPQGELGPTVINVLTFSTVATIILLAVVWLVFFRT